MDETCFGAIWLLYQTDLAHTKKFGQTFWQNDKRYHFVLYGQLQITVAFHTKLEIRRFFMMSTSNFIRLWHTNWWNIYFASVFHRIQIVSSLSRNVHFFPVVCLVFWIIIKMIWRCVNYPWFGCHFSPNLCSHIALTFYHLSVLIGTWYMKNMLLMSSNIAKAIHGRVRKVPITDK